MVHDTTTALPRRVVGAHHLHARYTTSIVLLESACFVIVLFHASPNTAKLPLVPRCCRQEGSNPERFQ